ncbi:MAG: ATP-binding protein, partial [Calditrichaeota bacterium]
MKYIPRNITPEILDALSTSPVVLLNGARQTGKSTLAQHLGRQRGFRYVSLDDLTVLEGISHDPSGYLMSLPLPVIIDEVQREPRLFRVIKMLVDRRRQPGQFFLTGSANVLMLPRMAEFLAGRMEILTLWPFSCDELMGRKSVFIDQVFSEHFPYFHEEDLLLPDLVRKLIQGGYPEILKLSSSRRRNAWFDAYITTILQRDVRDLARIEGLHELPRLLSLIAANAGAMLNLSDLSRRTGLVTMTLKRYLTLLEATFLVQRIPAWSGNIGKRLIKAPRIYLNDTGLLCYLLGCDEERLFKEPQMRGQVLENYVVQELHKQRVWSEARPG